MRRPNIGPATAGPAGPAATALDRPDGLKAFAEVFPVPTFGDVWLRTVGAFETAKVVSLCHK